MNLILQRLVIFRQHLVILWHAFWDPMTPTYLKVLTILTGLYVISPFDLISDILPILGWIDDFLIVSFALSWIVSRLPQTAPQRAYYEDDPDGKTINGTARRKKY